MTQEISIKRSPGRRPAEMGDAEDTRRAIFHHAMALINARGYEAVSMSDIARAAGLTKATLYYHFPSKADLLTAGALEMLGRVREHVERITEDRTLTVRERLTRMALARQRRLPGIAYNVALMEAAMAQLSDAQREQLRQAFDAIHQPLRDLIVEGIARGELRDLAPEHVALAFRQLFSESRHDGAGDAATAALLDLFFSGAAPSTPSSAAA